VSRRAVGIVRVSRVGARNGEQFVSPDEQAERIKAACASSGLDLVETLQELDVSGGAAIANRPGLSRAIELIEAKEAEVVVVAYFDRLARSLKVQAEVLERVERAGGEVLAVDVGQVSNGTAGQWLSGTLLGAVAEYHRRVTGERTAEAKRRAVERGVPPFPRIPPGYRRCVLPNAVDPRGAPKLGPLEIDPDTAPAVTEAFKLRAGGATIKQVHQHLREHGIERSWAGVQVLLGSRIYLGELRSGALVNPDSHPPIVDAATWQAVQRMRSPRGRLPKSERLLARQGILRCASCGSRMVIGSSSWGARTYHSYRCNPTSGDCPRRVSISADLVERIVVEKVHELTQGIAEGASLGEEIAAVEREAEAATQRRDALIAMLGELGLEDLEVAQEQLRSASELVRSAEQRASELRAAEAPALSVSVQGNWDDLSLAGKRALIRATVSCALVRPGRGPERVSVLGWQS
jgi:DNA invertase Pin-like site-specific DNA recombinase